MLDLLRSVAVGWWKALHHLCVCSFLPPPTLFFSVGVSILVDAYRGHKSLVNICECRKLHRGRICGLGKLEGGSLWVHVSFSSRRLPHDYP